jgi:hypothetical protein
MSISNLNNVHLNDTQIHAIKQAVVALDNAMQLLQVNLTPEDRNRYGRVNEQNKLFINKIYDYIMNNPDLCSRDVNWEEFKQDYKSRAFLEQLINDLESLITRAKNAKILHDFDNYQDALEDYAYTSFRARSKTVGYEDKHRELKQFFQKSRKKDEKKDQENP